MANGFDRCWVSKLLACSHSGLPVRAQSSLSKPKPTGFAPWIQHAEACRMNGDAREDLPHRYRYRCHHHHHLLKASLQGRLLRDRFLQVPFLPSSLPPSRGSSISRFSKTSSSNPPPLWRQPPPTKSALYRCPIPPPSPLPPPFTSQFPSAVLPPQFPTERQQKQSIRGRRWDFWIEINCAGRRRDNQTWFSTGHIHFTTAAQKCFCLLKASF